MTQVMSDQIAPDQEIETFQLPGEEGQSLAGGALQADVTSIVSVVGADFAFQQNANTPGRFLEQTRPVTRPPGSGFFVGVNTIRSSFTSNNFQTLTERPLGQIFVSVGLRGTDLVCQVRLTDSNSDDPIDIRVRAFIAFFN